HPTLLSRWLYLKEPVIDRRKGDPLQWWRQNEGRFKLLATQARTFLCPPPSSVPSERVFSEVSAIYEKNRSRLTGEPEAVGAGSRTQEPRRNEPMVDFQSPPALDADTQALKPH
ncbi:hypothetical protein JOQ06_023186, partial [Pogonophryne albipinna]